MFDYEEMTERLAKKYIKTETGYERLLDDLKEIYNHQFIDGFEIVIDNIVSGAYDTGKNLKNIYEFEYQLRVENNY